MGVGSMEVYSFASNALIYFYATCVRLDYAQESGSS